VPFCSVREGELRLPRPFSCVRTPSGELLVFSALVIAHSSHYSLCWVARGS